MKTFMWFYMKITAIPITSILLWMQFNSISYVQCWRRHVGYISIQPSTKRFLDGITRSTSLSRRIGRPKADSRPKSTFSTSTEFGTNRWGTKIEPDGNVYEDVLPESEISKLPRLYVGQVQLKPVPVSNITDLANAITSKTKRIEIPPLENKSVVQLSDDQAHYVLTVLRMFRKTLTSLDKTKRNSPQLRIFANGEEWLAELFMMVPTIFSSKQIQRRPNLNPPDQPVAICRKQLGSLVKQYKKQSPMHCWLCIAPPKNKDRVRWMIEKTTELDCTGYIFIDTEHSEETSDDYQKKKFPKMQAYCIEAAEQCERLNLPHFITVVRELSPNANLTNEQLTKELLDVPNVTKLNDLLQVWSEQKKNGVTLLICRERHNTVSVWDALEKIYTDNQKIDENDIVSTLSPNIYKTKAVVFLIGPEGGWSPTEQRMFNVLERDFPDHIYNVALSRTILRTETAAMTAMSTFAIHRNHILINEEQNEQKRTKELP